MSKNRPFRRDFEVAAIKPHLQIDKSIVRELFSRWVLPGQASHDGGKALRLALRDGYLNFYADGQSVARLSLHQSSLRMSVAFAYVPVGLSPTASTSGEVRFEGSQLEVDSPTDTVDEIVRLALDHKTRSAEKCFVEHLIADNANVIEVEMALPGETNRPSVRRKWRQENALRAANGENARKIAPRMDLVVVHVLTDGTPQIDFWEAKLASNSELRATLRDAGGEEEPNVREQLLDYERWMRLPDRQKQVAAAFMTAGRRLDELAAEAGKDGQARQIWRQLSAVTPVINPRPGIVIGNYHPSADENERIASADSFAKHRARLLGSYSEPGGVYFPPLDVVEVDNRNCDHRFFLRPMTIAQP